MKNGRTLLTVMCTIALFAAFSTETLAATRVQSRRTIKAVYNSKNRIDSGDGTVSFMAACVHAQSAIFHNTPASKDYKKYVVSIGDTGSVDCTTGKGNYSNTNGRFIYYKRVSIKRTSGERSTYTGRMNEYIGSCTSNISVKATSDNYFNVDLKASCLK